MTGRTHPPRAPVAERIARALARHVNGLALAVVIFACLFALAAGVGLFS